MDSEVNEIFEEVEPYLNDYHEDFNEFMKKIRPLLSREIYDELETTCNFRVYNAQECAFTAGYSLGVNSVSPDTDLQQQLDSAITTDAQRLLTRSISSLYNEN